MYYTHDHSDMSGKLHGKAFYSNFPSPKYDWDDDDGNGWYDEGEVVSLDKDFPVPNATYEFHTYWERKMAGNGYLYETPQLSGKPWCMSEYNTWRYDDNPQQLNYYTYGSMQSDSQLLLSEKTPIATSTSFTATLQTELGPLNVDISDNSPFLKAELAIPVIETQDDLHNYATKIKDTVVPALRKLGVKQAFTVITLKHPVHLDVLFDMVGKSAPLTVEVVKAIYIDRNNPDTETNVWTMQVNIENGDSIEKVLAPPDFSETEFESDVAQPDIQGETIEDIQADTEQINLELQGIVSIGLWLPLDTIDGLNNHELVYLADASPTYARVLAADSNIAKQFRFTHDIRTNDTRPDGAPSFVIVQPTFNDLYAEIQQLLLNQ